MRKYPLNDGRVKSFSIETYNGEGALCLKLYSLAENCNDPPGKCVLNLGVNN